MSAVGLPLSYLLAFRYSMGVIGLCIGTTIGTFVHMLLYMLILVRIDWTKESNRVQYVLKKEAFRRKYPTVSYPDESKYVTVISIAILHSHLFSSVFSLFDFKSQELLQDQNSAHYIQTF